MVLDVRCTRWSLVQFLARKNSIEWPTRRGGNDPILIGLAGSVPEDGAMTWLEPTIRSSSVVLDKELQRMQIASFVLLVKWLTG